MKTSIASLFGLTQREMAMALGIGLSQWSMYEGGKRALPLRAQLLLNEMLEHINTLGNAKRDKKTSRPISDPRHVAHLKSLLVDNTFEQARLTRKIEAMERKQIAANRYKSFSDFVDKHKTDKTKADANPMFIVKRAELRHAKPTERDFLFEQKIELELLVEKQRFLERKLKVLTEQQTNQL